MVVVNHLWHVQNILFQTQNRIILELGTSCIHFMIFPSRLSESPGCLLQVQSHTCAHLIFLAWGLPEAVVQDGGKGPRCICTCTTQMAGDAGWDLASISYRRQFWDAFYNAFQKTWLDRAAVAVREAVGEHVFVVAFPLSLLSVPCTTLLPMK